MPADRPLSNKTAGTHHQAETLAAEFPPLMVAAERVASTVSQGVHGRRRVGQGETFWQFRRYQFGDSTQLIDWRQSAKSQPVYIRETEWEAAQTVWLWRDGSPSMEYRSVMDIPTKEERADLLALALASLLVRGGERTALQETGMTPGASRAVLTRMWSIIEGKRLPTASLPSVELLPRYGRVVWFGDFLSPLDEVRTVLNAYSDQGIRGHIVQVLDPAEELLPYEGRVLFQGPEDEDGNVLVAHVGSVREDFRREIENHKSGLQALARSLGWSFMTHRTDHSPETVLLALYLNLSESVGG